MMHHENRNLSVKTFLVKLENESFTKYAKYNIMLGIVSEVLGIAEHLLISFLMKCIENLREPHFQKHANKVAIYEHFYYYSKNFN